MSILTKPAAEIFEPFNDSGTTRRIDANEVKTWGTEIEARLAGISTRTALKALPPGGFAYLTESGRAGFFVWQTGNFASKVSADTAEGIWIASDTVASSSGAWVRSFQGRARAEWFGIVADYNDSTGTGTDNTTAWAAMTAALAARPESEGGFIPVDLPAGKILLDSASYTQAKVSLHGDSMYGTVLVCDTTTGDFFTFGNDSAEIENVDLADITFDARTTRASGWAVKMNQVVRSTLRNINISSQDRAEDWGKELYDGIWFNGCDFVTWTGFQITVQNHGLRVNGELLAGGAQGNLFLDDGKIFFCGGYGVHVAGGFGGLTVGKVDVIANNYGMVVDNAIVTAHSNREIFLQPGAFFDNSTTHNITVTNNLQKLSISGGWLSTAGGSGLYIISMDGQVLISSAIIKGNTDDGIYAGDPDTQWVFGGAEIADNGAYGIRWTTTPTNPDAVVGATTILFSNNTSGSLLNLPVARISADSASGVDLEVQGITNGNIRMKPSGTGRVDFDYSGAFTAGTPGTTNGVLNVKINGTNVQIPCIV